jgi:prepilin-type N-terminal cleavage/methylation domain-containing protein
MKRLPPPRARTRWLVCGFTLIELIVTISIIAAIAAGGIPYMQQKLHVARATKASEEMKGWLEAGIAYYAATGAWPADANTLVTQGYMTSNDLNTPFGGTYSLAVSGTNLRVSANVTKLPDLVAGKLPFGTASGTTVTAAVTPPATEAAHTRLLNRYGDAGNNTMFAALNMNNNDITNAGTIGSVAANFSTVTATTGNITTVNANALYVAGNISADTGYLTGAFTASSIITSSLAVNGALSATTGDITTINSTTINSTAENTTTLNATTVNSGTVLLSTVVTAGAACSPDGSQARDSTGALLSCKSGAWASGGGIVTGGGSRQLLKALANQTIFCTSTSTNGVNFRGDAQVDVNGTPYVRFCYGNAGGCGGETTGWVQATLVSGGVWWPNGLSLQGGTYASLTGITVEAFDDASFYRGSCNALWTLGS